ncbi:MAG TPA: polysaccharide ABC transporter ATP-binding protein [Chthoniobacterales bacterium]|nr:polysaccharide ABC transporter ATP-binding protein [Chthoniobacterales bacterium]
MSVVIEAENISKRFFLGERNQRAFFEDVAAKSIRGFHRLLRPKEAQEEKASSRDFWALRDVSFRIIQGQTLGIIGENGAGKSTLLKILSRITQPTTGKVKVYGRLASLLEVGTGFHPEFSGRDNIYLNGTMLGLSRKEVRKRFDQIVEFSGLEQFIDVPVKNYSSGMYVRLAFSVAAHLNPEIVVLDEVLAVGDAVFQKKCFDRMEEIINEGHAAILVSHGMGNVRRMSQICMWLRHGRVEMFGPTHEVVSSYEKETTHEVVSHYERQTAEQHQATQPNPLASLSHWSVRSKLSTDPHTLISGQARVTFHFEIAITAVVPNGLISVSLADAQGLVLFTHEDDLRQTKPGNILLTLELPFLPLKPGEYIVTCTISDVKHPVAFLRATPELTVLEDRGSERSGYHGILNLPAKLSVEENIPSLGG